MYFEDHEAVRDGKAIATFAFDGGLTLRRFNIHTKLWENSESPNPEVMEALFRHASEGWDIIVIADRWERSQVTQFLEKYDVPTTAVFHMMGWDMKGYVETAESIVHYDSDLNNLLSLPEHIVGIRIPEPTKDDLPQVPIITQPASIESLVSKIYHHVKNTKDMIGLPEGEDHCTKVNYCDDWT